MHKICFVEKRGSISGATTSFMHQTGPTQDPFLKELITSLSVTDRPDLMIFRKFSATGGKVSLHKSRKKEGESTKAGGEDRAGSLTVAKSNYNLTECVFP